MDAAELGTPPEGMRLLLSGLWMARACLAVLFATALWHKARAPREFVEAVRQYRLLPTSLVAAGAIGVGLAETVVLAGLLSLPLSPAPFAWGAAGLLAAYGLAIAVNLGRGRDTIDCGCHGFSGRQRIAGWMVLRNLLLATVAALLALMTQRGDSLPMPAQTDWLGIGGATIVLCLLYGAVHHLAANAVRLARR